MDHAHAISLVTMARHAWLNGFPITADVYMRQALRCANRLRDGRYKRQIFVIRNKMRPRVAAALSPSPVGV
ncbi:hypothetical protein EN780_03300 [Mesorhizobium sp. M4B.F.Ca.ET.089.01.1.1]|uniref:hypothetical protein n=1 Tax=Mesorhizobium sp. M4B.F.Ca.ET.089.01.1.1 TaxID=2496662 RepID=UPI000FE3693D|nr:hypothetical protein [Mesorhizobium sp. M4B.F.Ca.ET.089.01.1.1]RWX70434.1 hypothetical protein EN780_03300 [Mesorhizobium sp. M4B.F.Ca.ET.089.01.1.1]